MNKNLLLYLILAFTVCTLVSCDAWHIVHGTVIDIETNEPIKGVQVSIIDEEQRFIATDSIGHFRIVNTANQAFKKAKNVCTEVRFEREGYKFLVKKFCAGKRDSIIYLERVK